MLNPIIRETLLRRLAIVEDPRRRLSDLVSFNIGASDKQEKTFLSFEDNFRKYLSTFLELTTKDEKQAFQKSLLPERIYVDNQSDWLKLYWKSEFLLNPHCQEIVIEGYFSDHSLIMWNWMQKRRLSPAVFQSKQDDDILINMCTALFSNKKRPQIVKNRFTSFYVSLSFQAIDISTSAEKLKSSGWWKVADILTRFTCDVYPYVGGQLCRALPMPAKKQGNIGEEWAISSEAVKGTLENLSIAWAEKRSTVYYISGAPGVGKEGTCSAIHHGKARQGEFHTVDMTSDTDHIISQLYGENIDGYIIPGMISVAKDGTLFLDEVMKSSPEVRKTLLRPIQSREYYPVNSSQVKNVGDVIFILASPESLDELRTKSRGGGEDGKKYGPYDLWTRIHSTIEIRHPLDVEDTKLGDVTRDLFRLSWISTFLEYFDKKIPEVIGLIESSGSSMAGRNRLLQPLDRVIANAWQQYVFRVFYSQGVAIRVSPAKQLKHATEIFLEEFTRMPVEQIKKYSIREFRKSVSRVANFTYEKQLHLEDEVDRRVLQRFIHNSVLR